MPSCGVRLRRKRCCWERRLRGTADAGLDQNPAHRRAAQVDALALPQQLGEMSMVGARIAVAGQLHHGSGGRLRDGVVRSSAPVPMGQCGGTVPAVSREETLGVAFAHSHDLGGLRDGKLVFQNTVEYLNPCLFLLVQRYIPHRDDMFAEQLAGDRIVEHQHGECGFTAMPARPGPESMPPNTHHLGREWLPRIPGHAGSGDVAPVQQPTCMGGLVTAYDRKVPFAYNRDSLQHRSLRLWPQPPNPLESTA